MLRGHYGWCEASDRAAVKKLDFILHAVRAWEDFKKRDVTLSSNNFTLAAMVLIHCRRMGVEKGQSEEH